MEFKTINYFRTATTLFVHDCGSRKTLKRNIRNIFRDAIEFTWPSNTEPRRDFLQRVIDALEELKSEL